MALTEGRLLKETEPFLSKYGIRIVDCKTCRKQRKVRVTDGDKTAMIVVSISPSDHRAYYNIAKSAKNALREAR